MGAERHAADNRKITLRANHFDFLSRMISKPAVRRPGSPENFEEKHKSVDQWQDAVVIDMADPASVIVAPRRGITRAECFSFLALVIVLAWPFGSFDRFPFDDEVATLDIIARHSVSELL